MTVALATPILISHLLGATYGRKLSSIPARIFQDLEAIIAYVHSKGKGAIVVKELGILETRYSNERIWER